MSFICFIRQEHMKKQFLYRFVACTGLQPGVLPFTGSVCRKKPFFIGQSTGFLPHFRLKRSPFGLFLIMNALKRGRNASEPVMNGAFLTHNPSFFASNSFFMTRSVSKRMMNERKCTRNVSGKVINRLLSSPFAVHVARSALQVDVVYPL